MCKGISCEIVWDGQRLDAKFGHPQEIRAGRDHHSKIRALHRIRESDGGPASRLHAPLECHATTTIDDAGGYALAFDAGERPQWWSEELADQFRKYHLATEIQRRMKRVIAGGLWPGSLTLIGDCVLPKELTFVGGDLHLGSWSGSVTSISRIGGPLYLPATIDFPALQTSGEIWAAVARSLYFPALRTSGDIWADAARSLYFPALRTSGYIRAAVARSLYFPALRTSGYIKADAATSLDFPALQTSGAIWADVARSLYFPALRTSGYIRAAAATSLDFPALQTSGTIWAAAATSLDFPALQTSGAIWADAATSLDFPESFRGKI